MAVLRFRGVVYYVDGSSDEFSAGNAALAAYERYAVRHKFPTGTEAPPTLSSMVIAHHALAIEQGFDAWAESVDGIELELENGAEAVPPTEPDPSTGGQ